MGGLAVLFLLGLYFVLAVIEVALMQSNGIKGDDSK